jgi:hypothetical protein
MKAEYAMTDVDAEFEKEWNANPWTGPLPILMRAACQTYFRAGWRASRCAETRRPDQPVEPRYQRIEPRSCERNTGDMP